MQKLYEVSNIGSVFLTGKCSLATPQEYQDQWSTGSPPTSAIKKPREKIVGKTWYFSSSFEYKKASKEYRNGNLDAQFPDGTYKPPPFTAARAGRIL